MEGIHKLSSVIRRVIQWIAMTDLVTSAPVSKGNSPFLTHFCFSQIFWLCLMALFHCMVRYGSARLGTVRYGSVRVGLHFHRSLVPL